MAAAVDTAVEAGMAAVGCSFVAGYMVLDYFVASRSVGDSIADYCTGVDKAVADSIVVDLDCSTAVDMDTVVVDIVAIHPAVGYIAGYIVAGMVVDYQNQ